VQLVISPPQPKSGNNLLPNPQNIARDFPQTRQVRNPFRRVYMP
jgi:hypothetical protein